MMRSYKSRSLERLPKIDYTENKVSYDLPIDLTNAVKSFRLPTLPNFPNTLPLSNITNGRNLQTAIDKQMKRYFVQIPKDYPNNLKILTLYNEFINTYLQATHFFTAFRNMQILNFCRQMVPITLNGDKSDKITLLFDLDQTLIRSNLKRNAFSDLEVKFKGSTANTKLTSTVNTVYVSLRPHLDDTLKQLSQHFQLGVFTASNKVYANPIINLIDPDNKYFHHRLFREHCTLIAGDVYVKDLRRIKNRSLDKILLVDNSPYSFANKKNAIPILAYHDDKDDKELLYLRDYLLALDKTNIVQENYRYWTGVYNAIECL